MFESVQKCTYCGANLSLDDLRRADCPYCKTVYPHKAAAQQQVEVSAQVMERLMAQQGQMMNDWRAAVGGAFGVPGGPPPVGGPPPNASPYGPAPNMMPYGMPPPPGAPGSPYADPQRIAAAQMAAAAGISRSVTRTITLVIVFSVIGVLLMAAAIVASVFVRMR